MNGPALADPEGFSAGRSGPSSSRPFALRRLAEQDKGVGDGAGGDAGRGVAGDENLFAVDQGRAEAGIEQDRLADALLLAARGRVRRRG